MSIEDRLKIQLLLAGNDDALDIENDTEEERVKKQTKEVFGDING